MEIFYFRFLLAGLNQFPIIFACIVHTLRVMPTRYWLLLQNSENYI